MEIKLLTTNKRVVELEEENARLKKKIEQHEESKTKDDDEDYIEVLNEVKQLRGATNM